MEEKKENDDVLEAIQPFPPPQTATHHNLQAATRGVSGFTQSARAKIERRSNRKRSEIVEIYGRAKSSVRCRNVYFS